MKLQSTPKLKLNTRNQNPKNKNYSKPSFKGGEAVTQVLNFLQTNQAVGATFVDASCMCAPRTIVDFTRGPEAGTETAIREFSSNINDAALGAYGVGAAFLLTQGLNKKYGVEANKMFVDNDALDFLADVRQRHGDINQSRKLRAYLGEIFESARGFNPEANNNRDPNGWVQVDEKTRKSIVDRLATDLSDTSTRTKEQIKETTDYVRALLIRSTGAETEFRIGESTAPIDDFIDNVYKVSKAFMSEKVVDTFKNGNAADNAFVKGLKRLNVGTAILGIAACSALGAAVQPINMYLTKKRTGSNAFVGGGEEDKSARFKFLKGAAAVVGAAAMWSTITTKPSKMLSKLQFKGLVPTLNQFKLVYSITIISRLLAARNENELRESSIKDSLGFANWLIFGGFASKLTAAAVEKLPQFKNKGIKFVKYNEEEHGKGWFNWITKSSIMTRQEVLHDALKKANIDVTTEGSSSKPHFLNSPLGWIKKNVFGIIPKETGGLMDLQEMLKAAAKHAPEARTKVKYLGVVQMAGYVWSGLALGIGIPKLNIAITNAIEKKKQKEQEENAPKLNEPSAEKLLAFKQKSIHEFAN